MIHAKISKPGDVIAVEVVDVIGKLTVTMTVSCPVDIPSVNTIV